MPVAGPIARTVIALSITAATAGCGLFTEVRSGPELDAAVFRYFGSDLGGRLIEARNELQLACPDGEFVLATEGGAAPFVGSDFELATDPWQPDPDSTSALSYVTHVARGRLAVSEPTDEVDAVVQLTINELLWQVEGRDDPRPTVQLAAEPSPCPWPDGEIVVAWRSGDLVGLDGAVLAATDAAGVPVANGAWEVAVGLTAIRTWADETGQGGEDELLLSLVVAAVAHQAALDGDTCDDYTVVCPPTSGLLGAWRRAMGLEPDPDGPTPAEAARQAELQAWLDTPWERRELSDILEDLPAGATEALGVIWRLHEVEVPRDDVEALGIDFIQLRFPGVGVVTYGVGPQATSVAYGLGPVDGPVEVVGGRGEFNDPSTELVVLKRFDRWPDVESYYLDVDVVNGEPVLR